jgi:hypothetical protein
MPGASHPFSVWKSDPEQHHHVPTKSPWSWLSEPYRSTVPCCTLHATMAAATCWLEATSGPVSS